MERKREVRKEKKTGRSAGAAESSELGMIRDRLLAQDPEGKSLDSYLRSLRETLGERPDLAAELVESLSRNPSTVGFRTFNVLRDLFEDKLYRRAVKQAAYRFAQKGFINDAEAAPVQTVVLIPKEVRKGIAHFLICDSTFWFLTALLPDEQYAFPTLLAAFIEEDFKRIHVTASEGSNRSYREFIEDAEKHFETKPVEIPVWHGAKLFFEMLDFAPSTDKSKELDAARRLLGPYHDPARPSLAYELLPELQQSFERMSDTDVGEFVRSISLVWYLLPKRELQPYWEMVQQLQGSVLVVPNEVQQDRTEDLLKRTARELVAGERRLRYERMFEEQALYFHLAGKEDLAGQSWIIAQQLKSDVDAGDIPVLFELVLISMKAHWPEEFEDTVEQSDRQEAKSEKRTESGLILL